MKISMHTHPVIHIDREQRLDRINIFIISLSLKALQILISTIEHTVSSSVLNVNIVIYSASCCFKLWNLLSLAEQKIFWRMLVVPY